METIIHAIRDVFYALARTAHRRIHFQFVESKLWINSSYISLCNNVTPQVISISRRLMLCLLISIATIDAFPCSYIVLTFRAAITVRCIGERRINHVGIRCCWLCRLHTLSRRPPPTRQLVYVWCFIFVSLTVVLFLGGVVSPTLNPQ